MTFARVHVHLSLVVVLLASRALGEDWPQLQHDPAHTGRSADEIAPPYRVRWMWCGAEGTLRNSNSVPGSIGWTNDLRSRDGYSFPLPDPVSHTLALGAQPVVVSNRVFIGDLQGRVYGISAYDGGTLWTNTIGGPVGYAAAVAGSNVLFASIHGRVAAYDCASGALRWAAGLPRPCVSAPCIIGTRVMVTCLDGRLRAFDVFTGAPLWTSPWLGAPLQGGVAADATAAYLGADNLWFYKLALADGSVLASNRLFGSSFRLLWPVIYTNLVLVRTCSALVVGSEYIMENVMRDSSNLTNEADNILRWMRGDTNGGAWPDAYSNDWRHLFALRTSDLQEPFVIPNGPIEGCGMPAEPPCIDQQGRILTWWKTRYPTLLPEGGIFGSLYGCDISGINPATGRRVLIQNAARANIMRETDNLFALSIGGNYVYLRQDFRGTQCIHLPSSDTVFIQVQQRYNDGGSFAQAHICYIDGDLSQSGPEPLMPDTPEPTLQARVAPTIAGNTLFLTEEYCVTCIEHEP